MQTFGPSSRIRPYNPDSDEAIIHAETHFNVKPQDVRQSLFIMTLYTMLRITYSKTFHVVKYYCNNVVKIFCLLGSNDSIYNLYRIEILLPVFNKSKNSVEFIKLESQ